MIKQFISGSETFISKIDKEEYSFLHALPVSYLNFVKENGAPQFNADLKVVRANVSYSIGDFYTADEISDFLLTDESLPDGFIPFCEGQTNDYIGFKRNDECVYYLYADRSNDDIGNCIGSNFDDFINNIVPQQTDEDDKRKIISVSLTAEFLDLLKNREE